MPLKDREGTEAVAVTPAGKTRLPNPDPGTFAASYLKLLPLLAFPLELKVSDWKAAPP